jgi:putative SOS response-associated peptidase YedK
MCGRFTQQTPTSEIARIFEAEDLFDDPGQRFNIAPTDEAAVVVQRDDRRAVVGYRWGLIPNWSDDPRMASRTFNARAETVATSQVFRDAFRRRRCIVPTDGFYEWLRDDGRRQPMRIHDAGGGLLALAGLWTGRQDPESGIWHRTFTIVTTRPNTFLARIHDRMPVVLPPDAWATWLDPARRDPGELRALLEPRETLALEAYPVPPLVNNVRNNGPELISRLDPGDAALTLPLA